jgi:uncharacterized protein YggT (Ycf19 family)
MKFTFMFILIYIFAFLFWVLLARDFNTVGKIVNKIIKPFKNEGKENINE